jgi:uncharacterized membrane protein HdeD (DUF308 family)
LIRLAIARVCVALLAGLYLVGGVAAVSGYFQMQAGPADLAAWFSSNGMSPSRFLVVGMFYCAVGVTGIAAAWVLRRNKTRGRLLASVFIVLVALDILRDLYRKRTTGFDLADVVTTALSGALLLVVGVYLVRSRRRFKTETT